MAHSRFLSLILLLVLTSQPLPLPAQSPGRSGSDAAWERLTAQLAPRTERDAPLRTPADWADFVAEARKFQEEHPDHPQARSAAKLELTARIMGEEGKPELAHETTLAVTAYLNDTRNAVRDRLLLKIDFDQAKLRRTKHDTREAHIQAQTAHAFELMRDFPDEPEGYGYLLGLARLAPPADGGALADQLLADQKTPARFKDMARRIAERRGLLGKPLRLDGAETQIGRAVGQTLVIYSWRVEDEGFRSILKRMAFLPNVAFIGINLDENEAAARTAARDLPGTQFYDGGGLDGVLATQLKLVLHTSIYLVDGQGILRDLDAHRAPYGQVSRFLGSTGGAR